MKKLLLMTLFLSFAPLMALAQSYVPLETLPYVSPNSNFAQLLAGAFQLTILAGAALAVLMLTIGGVQYMTSDALNMKEQGRERIKNALLGFLLLLAIYVILNTINPNLLKFQLITNPVGNPNLQTPTTQTPTVISQDVVLPGAGETLDPNTMVVITRTDGIVLGVKKNSPTCQTRVDSELSTGEMGAPTISGTCNK